MQKKIVTFVGDKEVGKSSIISQIVYKEFSQRLQYDVCKFVRDDVFYEISHNQHPNQSKNVTSNIIVYVYCWDKPESYRWVEKSLKNHPKGIPAIVVCNKIDLIGGHTWDEFGLERVFVSAKENRNIHYLFDKIHSTQISVDHHDVDESSCCAVL